MTTDLARAQADMRFAYFGGAAGMLASSIAWLCAAVAAAQVAPRQAVWVLFIGGMLIHPLGVLIAKLLGRPGNHSKGNPLGSLALASTAWLIFSLPLAYAVSLLRIEWFFPAMLLVIGGRYLVFSSLFGMRIYWVCGLALAGAGYFLAQAGASPTLGAAAGAAIEAVFAAAIFVLNRRELRSNSSFDQKPLRGSP
ncbi:DUF7010 family protein [Montanilutibacter psychrotolerans]|uniref:Uncharacterized protein n=1 Tax=Montanilutibacter psychrotolerans TaxID=1327343 RepID=A0A3M8T0T2_9GAMM|nr:hypothetical protein [Lysobacter psychrotolerans]RNF85276.1 hypothetical protein EER27_05800 [Lysobacter psychrotolerans]